MKSANSLSRTAGSRLAAFIVLALIADAGLVGAETYESGGSTATIEQSGGTGDSESQITHFPDGQRIVTRDGSSTDITVQHNKHFSSSDSWVPPRAGSERFEMRSIEERFSNMYPAQPSADTCIECMRSSTREEFKRQILNRMRGHDSP